MQECLYAVYKNERFTRFMFSNNSIEPPKDLTPQPTKRDDAGIASFDDRAIFLIEGKVEGNSDGSSDGVEDGVEAGLAGAAPAPAAVSALLAGISSA